MATLTLRNVKGSPLTNTEVDTNFSNLNSDKLEIDGSNSMSGKLTTVISSTTRASILLTPGSADPSSPVSGDFWNNTGVLKFYDGASTYVLTTNTGNQTLTNKTLDAPIISNGIYFEGATADAFETYLTVVDPTADNTITLPDATDTVVLVALNQTLTNKTLTTPVIAEIDSPTDLTLDAATDIILDADGADIILKDGGTEFGRFTQTGGELVVRSGSGAVTALTFAGANATLTGDLTVTGNDIKSSTATALTLAGADVAVAGDLTVTGNDIKSSSATALTLSGADVEVKGDLQVTGNDIKSSTGATAISLNGTAVTIAGDLTINGTTTTVNSTTLDVDDLNITVAKGNTSDLGANGAGITVEATGSTNKTFTWDNTNSSWTSSEHMNIAAGKVYKIGGTQIAATNLSNGTTGSGSIVLSTSPQISAIELGHASDTTLARSAAGTVTIEGVTVATASNSLALTNKTISGANNTISNIANASLTNSTISGISLGSNLADLTVGTGVTLNSGTTYNGGTAKTISIGQAVATTSDVQFDSFGVGTAASGVTGEIRATNEITAYYTSDARLKENVVDIEDALTKVMAIRGVTFDWTQEHVDERGGEDGYFVRKHDVGVIAQEVESVLPEVVAERDNGFKAVRYEKMVPLLLQAIKELKMELEEVKKNCNCNK